MIRNISRGHISVELDGKVATLAGEMFFPGDGKMGFLLYADSATHWDLPNQNVALTAEDIKSIIDEIKSDFAKGGHVLDVE